MVVNKVEVIKVIVEKASPMWYNSIRCGGVAQLGECLLRMQEVESSNLFVSTKTNKATGLRPHGF